MKGTKWEEGSHFRPVKQQQALTLWHNLTIHASYWLTMFSEAAGEFIQEVSPFACVLIAAADRCSALNNIGELAKYIQACFHAVNEQNPLQTCSGW